MSARAWLVELPGASPVEQLQVHYFRRYADARSFAASVRRHGGDVLSGPRVVYGYCMPRLGWRWTRRGQYCQVSVPT